MVSALFFLILSLSIHGAYCCDNWQYDGCYADNTPDQPLLLSGWGSEQMNPGHISAVTCREDCNFDRYSMAGVYDSDLCYCANGKTRTIDPIDVNQCRPCADDPKTFCGGNGTISVYSCAGKKVSSAALNAIAAQNQAAAKAEMAKLQQQAAAPAQEPVQPPPEKQQPTVFKKKYFPITCLNWDHVGQFEDTTYFRLLETKPTSELSGPISPSTCMEACSRERFPWAGIGLERDTSTTHSCFCGKTFPRHPYKPSMIQHQKLPDSTPRVPCPGRPATELCGGKLSLDIYRCNECQWSFGGCREDGAHLFVGGTTAEVPKLSAGKCKAACLGLGFSNAGLMAGKCHCGSGARNHTLSGDGCEQRCEQGNKFKSCGGASTMYSFQCNELKPRVAACQKKNFVQRFISFLPPFRGC